MNIAEMTMKQEELRLALVDLQQAKDMIAQALSAQKLSAVLVRLGFLNGTDGQTQPKEPEEATAATETPTMTAKTGVPAKPMVNRKVIAIPEKPSARQKANNAAIALLKQIEADGLTRDDLTDEQLETLATYTGAGGGIKADSGLIGSAYEYYTPKEVAIELWDVAEALGFKGGKVLDPSAGTGIFAAMSPENAVVDSIELDSVSGGIAKVLNDSERSNTIVSPFELQAKTMPDNSLDMVMTNVPFGDNNTRGANAEKDNCYQKESLQNYFILRSLEKLKHGGLAVFIVPTSVISGLDAGSKRLRNKASLKAELVGACRLPNSVFEQTGADVVTDVVIYRKHSRDASDKIKELYAAGDTDALTAANVLWPEYLDGKYFKQPENKKFVLGDIVQEKNRWGKLADTVKDHGGVKKTPEIAKMVRKFGPSRINWDLLGAAEAEIIEYKNGDTIFQDGQQLEYKNGRWIALEKTVTNTDREMQERLAVMGSALDMIVAGVTFTQVEEVIEYGSVTGQNGLIPLATVSLIESTQTMPPAKRDGAWHCVLGAQAIQDAIAKHGYGFDFVTGEPVLTAFLKTAFLDGKNSKLTGTPKQDHSLIALHYANGKYSSAWRGAVNTEIKDLDAASNYQSVLARMQYENKSLYLDREQLAKIDPSADPLAGNEWFMNHDGSKIIAANDFLVGNLADRLADIDAEIEKATDPAIIDKLKRQKNFARDSVTRIDLAKLEVDLRTPLISAENKVRFLKQMVHKDAFIAYDANGNPRPDINVKDTTGSRRDVDEGKLYNRIGDWINKGTITLGGVKLEVIKQREALDWITNAINTANVQFNSWIRVNKSVLATLEEQTSDEKNLFFTQNADESPIDIAGMNPKLNLHGYQNAFVRAQGRFFGGINGMGVGLGKTFTALASVKHVHNIGAKKKTVFIVPNSVLSNWRKEAQFAYTDTNDCIFIGLREQGDKFRVYSNKYDEDLTAAIDGQYRKIFMTFEAFARIRLKEDTIADYTQYIKDTDTAFEDKATHKDDERTKGMTSKMITRLSVKSNAPFLEDMNVDSVVIDEAHAFKNSIGAPKTDSGIKYLSQPEQSKRGEGAQAKLWYIRSLTANKDGVQLLTATPITNSPLEIYSMMALAAGRDTVNKMCGGIKGADDFIQVMCQIEEEVVPTIDGGERSQNVFTGIRNASMLRNLVNSQADIKDAQDVGMSVVIPDREEVATSINLGYEAQVQLALFQDAYATAKEWMKDYPDPALSNPDHPQSPFNPKSPINQVMKKYDEPIDLVAAPFNLIRKMDVVIADVEFAERASFYDFDPAQEKLAQKVVDKFNSTATKEERKRLSPYTNPDDATAIHVKDGDEKVLVGYKIQCMAKIIFHDGRKRIVIDTLNGKTQGNFEDIAEKLKLNLDVTIPAKIAALIENVKSEKANPRGANDDGTATKIVKQIIFCDHLFLHNKIKRALVKLAGVKAGKIAIITGQINNEPDEMIDIQDGFNAGGDDNVYQIVIANKKAEVGINLQRGTQAIHHLTTGWTPDSLEQRNGRGARQGNKTQKVVIYHYDADGTFDEFKRTMIDKKDEWITNVLHDNGKNTIEVSGSITNAEKDALISTSGNKEAMREFMANREAAEVEQRRQNALKRQSVSIQTIEEQTRLMANLSPEHFFDQEVIDIVSMIREIRPLKNKIDNPKTTAAAAEKARASYEQQKSIIIGRIDDVLSGVKMTKPMIIDGVQVAVTNTKYESGPEEIYTRVLDETAEYKPSESNRWPALFVRKALTSNEEHKNGGTFEIEEDSHYQAAFDETKATAEGFINQSVIAANYIAEEMGVQGVELPANAGELIASKQATIIDGRFVQVGSFILDMSAPDAAMSVVRSDFKIIKGEERLGPRTRKMTILTDSTSPQFFSFRGREVVLPTDSRYLSIVKRAAAVEDDWHSRALLTETHSVFSNNVPLVAEYRDTSVVPLYPLATGFERQHAKLDNCSIPMMLPFGVLNAGTEFSRAAIAAYEKAGVTIDISTGKYSIANDSAINITTDYYSENLYSTPFFTGIIELIKATGAKITNADTELMNKPKILANIVTYKGENVVNAVDAAINKLAADSDPALFELVVAKIYNDNIGGQAELPEDDLIKVEVINLIYAGVKQLSGGYNIIKTMSNTLSSLLAKAALDAIREVASDDAGDASATTADTGLTDETVVFIGGNTMDNKDTIKQYAKEYGRVVARGKKACWYGKVDAWAITYSAWRKMIEDKPSLADELTIRTTYEK